MVEKIAGGTATQFVYSPSGTNIALVSAGVLIKGMVPLPGGDTAIYSGAAGNPSIRHTDWLGSSRLATTWAHTVQSREAYAPFGEAYNEAGTPDRSFTGQDQDLITGSGGTGVYDFLFRKYDPSAGRWLSPDPYDGSYDITNPQSMNRYAYVLNNPLAFVDPMGLDGLCGSTGQNSRFGKGPDDFGGPKMDAWSGNLTTYCLDFDIGGYYGGFGGYGGVFGGGGVSGAPSNQMQTCTVNAHGVENNLPTRAPNRAGAYGVPETPGTAAIDRSQWLPPGSSSWTSAQANAYINQYRTQISGYIPNGNGGYIQVFNGVSDNMGPASGVAALIQRYPGRVLFELPGGQDLGNVNGMQFKVPSAMTCPNPNP